MRINNSSYMVLMAMVLALSGCDQAENAPVTTGESRLRLDTNNAYAQFGDHVIHVSAMLSSDLSAEVAQSYDIVRSQNQGLVNLVVLHKSDNMGVDFPVAAKVTLSAANLTGQMKNTTLREFLEGPSIYYISQVAVNDREVINFDFNIQPEGSNQELLVRFSHQFYTR